MALVTQGLSILTNQSLSTSLAISGATQQVVGLILPPAWDPAPITFQWSNDNAKWYDIFDRTGKESTFAWTASAFVPIQSQYGFYSFPYLIVRSGSRAKAIPQTAARQFVVVSQ
jgi:hypothetical protein